MSQLVSLKTSHSALLLEKKIKTVGKMIQVHEKSGMIHASGRTERSNLDGGTPALPPE